MKELKTAGVRLPDSPLVPYPSRSLVPERDVRYTPVLEASRLGIDFGGLTAVDDFTLTIGRTEIAGLIGPNGAGKTTVFNLLTSVYQPTRAASSSMGCQRRASPPIRSAAWASPVPSRISGFTTI